MKWNYLLFISIFLLAGCESEQTFGKKAYAASRPCMEQVFKCLPESVDSEYLARWEAFEMTDREQLSPDDSEAQAEARLLAFMDEIMQAIEEQLPRFWQGVDKKTRYAWMNVAFDKADKYGFDDRNSGFVFIEFLSRIGLDFDLQPANKDLVKFLKDESIWKAGRVGDARDYVDLVLLDREYNVEEAQMSLWGLQSILGVMPMPKRPLPELPTHKK